MCAPVAVTTANAVVTASSGMQAVLINQILALSTVIGVLAFKAMYAIKNVWLKVTRNS